MTAAGSASGIATNPDNGKPPLAPSATSSSSAAAAASREAVAAGAVLEGSAVSAAALVPSSFGPLEGGPSTQAAAAIRDGKRAANISVKDPSGDRGSPTSADREDSKSGSGSSSGGGGVDGARHGSLVPAPVVVGGGIGGDITAVQNLRISVPQDNGSLDPRGSGSGGMIRSDSGGGGSAGDLRLERMSSSVSGSGSATPAIIAPRFWVKVVGDVGRPGAASNDSEESGSDEDTSDEAFMRRHTVGWRSW